MLTFILLIGAFLALSFMDGAMEASTFSPSERKKYRQKRGIC